MGHWTIFRWSQSVWFKKKYFNPPLPLLVMSSRSHSSEDPYCNPPSVECWPYEHQHCMLVPLPLVSSSPSLPPCRCQSRQSGRSRPSSSQTSPTSCRTVRWWLNIAQAHGHIYVCKAQASRDTAVWDTGHSGLGYRSQQLGIQVTVVGDTGYSGFRIQVTAVRDTAHSGLGYRLQWLAIQVTVSLGYRSHWFSS